MAPDTTTTTTTTRRLIIRDLLSGSCAGAFTILAVHPLDNLRTRMQVLDVRSSPRQVISALREKEGIRAFYKGLTVPLAAQGVYKAVIFTTVGITKRYFNTYYQLNEHVLAAICGGMAGCVNALVVTPVEMVRNRQMLTTSMFASPLDAAKMAISQHGPMGLFRGLHLTMLRDGLGLACWFMVFNGVHMHLKQIWPSFSSPTVLVAMSGAAAGIGFWSVALPLDALKSHVQNGNSMVSFFSPDRKYYRGYSVAAPRGLIAAAITFSVQFQASNWLDARLL